jgi:hypothetical protein
MITPAQHRILVKEYQRNGGVICRAAAKADMHPETAAHYLNANMGPEEMKTAKGPRAYRTRPDPLKEIMPVAIGFLETAPELDAKGLLEHLKSTQPSQAGHVALRTFQRAVMHWKTVNGPKKEVFFAQEKQPGIAGQFDWTHASELGVTIEGEPLNHMLGHLVLPYSNWEWAKVCYSESFCSLKTGVQAALWALGAAPKQLWTDNSSSATHQIARGSEERRFNAGYEEFCRHLGVQPRTINIACPNEQGDVECAHRHLLRRLRTHLTLRGTKDFATVVEYQAFVERVCTGANALRSAKVAEELVVLQALPMSRYPETEQVSARVGVGSTVRVKKQTYSVPSTLIGLKLDALVGEHDVRLSHQGKEVYVLPRIKGGKPWIDYRHVVSSLVKKPGAFRDYTFREEMFPSLVFRQAYEGLCKAEEGRADARYLRVLELAATHGEDAVAVILGECLREGELALPELVSERIDRVQPAGVAMAAFVPDLKAYDALLTEVSA